MAVRACLALFALLVAVLVSCAEPAASPPGSVVGSSAGMPYPSPTDPEEPEESGKSSQLQLDPERGPIGTRVLIQGDGYKGLRVDSNGRIAAYGIALVRTFYKSGCELLGFSKHKVQVSQAGQLSGWFIVPPQGDCAQIGTNQRVHPGKYEVIPGCHTCGVGTFKVTKS